MRIFLGLAVLAMVAAPAWANMLNDSTGGFEDPFPEPPPSTLVWQSTKTGGLLERDSTIWGPAAQPVETTTAACSRVAAARTSAGCPA